MQPTDYALGLLFAAWLNLAGWGLVVYGVALQLGGLFAIVWVIARWGGVTLGPPPRKLAAPPAAVLPRVDSDTGVVARIPGATPEVPKERTEDGEALPVVLPFAALAPQIAALGRYLAAVDASTEELAVAADVTVELVRDGNHTAAAEVDEAILRRVVDGLREPDPVPEVADDCPLTTQEIPPLDQALPEYETTVRRAQTQDLSAVMEKVKQA
jgi:hypothetical protein